LLRLAVNKLPDERIEAAKLGLDLQELLRVGHGCDHFQPVAHDARILQQGLYFTRPIAGNASGIEAVECGAVVLALFEDSDPAQPRLGAFKNQKLKQGLVIVQWHAPFGIVVGLI
jgi:hypothetical protein